MTQEPLDLPPDTAATIDRLGLEFLANVLGVEVARRPANFGALFELGNVLTRLGRHDEGLAIDLELVRLEPDNATAHYNVGCSLALLGRVEEALSSLERSVELGFADADHLEADVDLVALHGEKRFQDLVALLRLRSETA